MIVALVFAHVWGVIQLIVLGSLTRTVRVRTVFMALAVGLYLCAPLAVVLQMGWTRPAAWMTGVPLWAMKDTAAYTANPFIEEILKVLPVAALLLFPAIRRQWSLTDCVLTGAAAGSGFGLSESLFRYGAAAHKATAIDHGWVLTTNISFPVVPGVWNTITSWLPDAAAPWDQISASGRFPPNPHLVWSAVGGLAVGLIMLRRGWRWRTLGAALLLYVALDHTAWNAAISSQQFVGRAAMEQLRTLWLTPILALALAWWLDRQCQHAGKGDDVSLAAEQSAAPRLVGTMRAAISRLPGSLGQVYGFVRMRRAHNSERALPGAHGAGDLSAALVDLRDRVDSQLAHHRSSWLPGWSRALGATLRRPSVIAWLLLMIPSVMWFVVGGLPQSAALQTMMTEPLAWKGVVALSLIAQAWLAWRIVHGLRALPMLRQSPWSDDVAVFALRIACGVGAVGLGGHALMRAFSGFSPNSSLLDFSNQTDAYASGSPATGLQLANSGASVNPPVIGSDAWRRGYKEGSFGIPQSYPRGASPGEVEAYDMGYRTSQGSDPNAAVREPGIRQSLPGEETVSRHIPVLDDDGVGYHMEYVTGNQAYLDLREAAERQKISDIQISGLGAAAKGVTGNTAPRWAPAGTLGAAPSGDSKVGESVSPEDRPAHKWPPN